MGHAYNFRAEGAPPKPPKTGAKLLDIAVKKAKSGGHIATHEFEGAAPEEHVFGAGEGPKLMAHLAKHLGIKAPAAPPVPSGQPGANALEQ
jgi:hypothetical protein